jgi:cytohesin
MLQTPAHLCFLSAQHPLTMRRLWMSDQTDILLLLDEAALAYLRDMKRKKDAIRKEIALLEHQMIEVTERLLSHLYLHMQTDIKIEEEKKKLGLSAESLDRDTLLDHARKRFKISPKAGLDYLREMNFFEQRGTPQEIARFFFEVRVPCVCMSHPCSPAQTPDISKAAIGDYLGEHHQANVDTLREFASLHDFTALDFDAALRQYLWSFRLPGESQKIDRMMEAFAMRLCQCHPGRVICVPTKCQSNAPSRDVPAPGCVLRVRVLVHHAQHQSA